MAGTKEIKGRIKSIKDTQKITNAMYMIASTPAYLSLSIRRSDYI